MTKFFIKISMLVLVLSLATVSLSAQIKVTCVGNSITEGWNGNPPYVPILQKLLGSNYIVQNCGKSGATVLKKGDVPYWKQTAFSETLKSNANIITIMLGTNDTKPQNWDSYGSEFTSDYKALIDTLSKSNKNAKIFLVLPPPVWKNPYGIRNEIIQLEIPIIKEIAKGKGLKVIDANTPFLQDSNYFADGVHPNDLGAYSIAGLIYRSFAHSDKPSPDSTGRKLRVVISSDFPPLDVIPGGAGYGPADKRSDPDDVQSMVRFLLYTNNFDVEGLIASAGTFAGIARKQNILDILNKYDSVYVNLKKHDARYPTPDYLRSVTWQGRDHTWGSSSFGKPDRPVNEIIGKGMDNEASNAIIKIVDKPNPRPVWFCFWGGSRELAQAIWKVRATRSASDLKAFLSKIRIYMIGKQDVTAQWLLDNFPNLFVILSEKNYEGMFWSASGSDTTLANLTWIDKHIRKGHGPLGAVYPKSGYDPTYPGQKEGDSPSFLYLVSAVQGLNNSEKPNQPSWGGQFVRPDSTKNHWFDDPAGPETVFRWRRQVQADFERRANWMLP